MNEKINNNNLYNDPYPHLLIDNFFDINLINQIIENFPDIEYFKNTKRHEQIINNKATRQSFYLDNKDDFNKINNKKLFKEFYKKISNKIFIKDIFKIFNKECPEDYHIQCQLIYDTKGFNILPHCDNFKNKRHKYLTILLYLPDDNNFVNYGTELYKENKNGKIHYTDKEINKERYFDIVKKASYKKNTLFAFIPEYNKSWHGVSSIKDNIKRRSIQIFLKEKKAINYTIEESLFT